MKEIWKDIKGYENLYKVSNLGRIKSISKNTKNQHAYQEIILKDIYDKDGYCQVNLYKNRKGKTYKVHRLVALAFLGEYYNLEVNHKDGNKKNNCVNNLEWCSRSENTIHAYKIGLAKAKKGKENEHSKPVIVKKGDFMKRFESEGQASIFIRVRKQSISDCVCGRKKTCKGYEVYFE